ncbi:unnamed protein product [Oikopleura dioica]|uniref:Uncharacterized protein n=1 Tax=Oikopleura dioica TaxID=34765 RepID=E4X8K6_OIKDI|nr:unnamed protein product [Oikopleura dioica]CBY37114.1 unnamed protein product [Oikopleura dioica]
MSEIKSSSISTSIWSASDAKFLTPRRTHRSFISAVTINEDDDNFSEERIPIIKTPKPTEQEAGEEECIFCEKVFLTMRFWNEKWQNRDKH